MVGIEVGRRDGTFEGIAVGIEVGRNDGILEGINVGRKLGRNEGALGKLGLPDGILEKLGRNDGTFEGGTEGVEVGRNEGFFVNIVDGFKLGDIVLDTVFTISSDTDKLIAFNIIIIILF